MPVEGTQDQAYIQHSEENAWCEAKSNKFKCKKTGQYSNKHKFIVEQWEVAKPNECNKDYWPATYVSLQKQNKGGHVCSDELDDGVRCNRNYIEQAERFRA